MKLKEKLTIDEFDGKKFQIKFADGETSNHKKAVITHYLHNIDNGIGKHFKKDAISYLNEYINFQKVEFKVATVMDVALQQLLFEVNDVPFPTPENYTFKFIYI